MNMNTLAWSMADAKGTLERLIRGREDSDEKVDPQAKTGSKLAAKIKVVVDGDSVSFQVHADTRCSAVRDFLRKVTPERISITEVGKKGRRLGVDSKVIDKFNVYAKR
ncbi:MAG: hypothetical protein HY074_01900 [Deltaproteobacteria bacterium]|nr:hypothetical protein [Deltaproteobacteria bacterium]